MRIAYIITRADAVGGAQVHVRDLAAALIRDGHEAKVFVGGTGPATDALAAAGVPWHSLRHLVHPVRPWRDVQAVRELARALRGFAPDLVSTHSSKAGMIGRIAARRAGIPAIFTAHGWAFTEGISPVKRRAYALAERVAARWAARIITVSEFDRKIALRAAVGTPDQLVAVHNGMPDVPPGCRAQNAQQPPTVIMVARFEKQKDHRTLLIALSQLKHCPWTVQFVGGGPFVASMQQLAASLAIADRTEFLGNSTSVSAHLARAHLFALTTHYEGLPRSIIEAMRAALPVVASAVGGVPELVEDGVTGFLVPRNDPIALRDRLARLLADPALRASMGRAGRLRYEQHFTFDRMYAQTLAVYQQVLSRRSAIRSPASEPDE